MKAALYARCSTKKQDLDSQLKVLNDWATKQGYEFILYQDLAISGRKNDRQGINDLMIAARNKEFNIVAVVELSRIGRSIGFICSTVKELSDLGIPIVLVNTNTTIDYKTLEGSALVNAMAMAADIEMRLILDRNARGRQKIKDAGIKVGRKRLSEKKIISVEAIKLMDAKGMSLREIAKELGCSAPTIMRYIKRYKDGHLCNVTESKQQSNDIKQN